MKREPPKLQHAALVVFLFVALAYVRSVEFAFTYDDHNHVVRNPFLQDLGNLRQFLPWRYFALEIPDQGRPLLVLSHFLDRALGGSAAVAHLQSTLWHGATAVLVLFVARALGFSIMAAALSALIFGLHPLNVEAVAGISNREDVLSAFFVMLGVLAYLRAAAGSGRAVLALGAAYAAALAAKESAISLPLLLVLVAFASFHHRPRGRRELAAIGVALALVTAGWAAFQLRLGYPALVPGAGGAALERAALVPPGPLPVLAGFARADEPAVARQPASAALLRDAPALEAFRAGQLVTGVPSAPEYELAPLRTRTAFAVGLLALAALAAVAWRDARRSRKLTLAIGWFFAASLPVAIPGLLLNPLADRYLYLPSIGFALGVGWLLGARLPDWSRRPDAGNWAGLAVTLIYFALLQSHLAIWKNDVELFSAAARWAPRSARVQQNLGSALLAEGRVDEAARALQRATELDPALTAAHVNLAVLAERLGQRRAAIRHYRAAVEGPAVAAERKLVERACIRLGTLLFAQRDWRAVEELIAREKQRAQPSSCAPELERRLEK